MRILIDSLIALMLVAGIIVLLSIHTDRRQHMQDVQQVQSALDRLSEQAAYHTTVQSAMAGQDTMLVHLHEQWFGDDVPRNVLLGDAHPWIDLAPPGDLGTHPPDPVATELGQAGFWYNPTTGTFRARVAPRSSEAQTLALYNQVNGTSLEAFEQIPDPTRQPIAHAPGSVPAHQYASVANQTWNATEQDEPADEQPLYVTPGDDVQPYPDVAEDAGQADDTPSQPESEPAIEAVDEPEPATASVRPTLE